ncbi:MAG: glutathione S-transferase family protein [Alphaproteobacteria bacterium]|nr:glutathione S-transferase family protein [Alphaproteobacteria bacterium]
MKLYNHAMAPNAWRVRAFLVEKTANIPTVTVEFEKGDTQTPDFLAMNSLGQVPVLELDDGKALAESIAICRYLESQFPEPSLFGTTAHGQAWVEMWNRRMELLLMNTVANVGLHTLPFFATRVNQVPEVAEAQKETLAARWAWLNEDIADGRPFVAGDTLSVADLTGMTALKICDIVELSVPEDLSHVKKWENAVRARPSWSA